MSKQLFFYFAVFLVVALIEAKNQPQPLDTGDLRGARRWVGEMRSEIQKVELVKPGEKESDDEKIDSKPENRSETSNLVKTKDNDREFRREEVSDSEPNCLMECHSNCAEKCHMNKFNHGKCVAIPKCSCQCI